jgi:uncharacterized repeat protein (TIGR01451 family)
MSKWHVMRRRPTTISGVAVLVVVATVGLALATAIAAQPVPNADLAIVSNTPSAKHAKVGDQVTFTIVATNNGPDAADFNVMWSSDQLQLVSETCDLGISADTPTCEYGTLEPGVTLTTTVVAEVLSTGSKLAIGTGCMVEQTGLINDPNPENNCADATLKIVGKR